MQMAGILTCLFLVKECMVLFITCLLIRAFVIMAACLRRNPFICRIAIRLQG